jgi:RND superfamily putative drug exporter
MLHRITDFSSSRRGKWIVIAIWLVLAAVVVPLAPSLSEVTNNDSSTFLPNDAETTEVDRLLEEGLPSDTTPALLVF